MRFLSFFSVAFLFNLGLLAALGAAVDLPLWGDFSRLLGCLEYSGAVALVFALAAASRKGVSGSPRDPSDSRLRRATRAPLTEVPSELALH